MGKTVKVQKKATIQKKKKATPKRNRRTKAKVSNRYEPARYKAQVSMIDQSKQDEEEDRKSGALISPLIGLIQNRIIHQNDIY